MNNINFSKQDKPDFIKELRAKVKDYFETNNISKTGNYSIVMKSIFMTALYFVPYFLMLTGIVISLPGMLICWILMGLGMAGVGMVLMHDANHGTFSKNQKTNKFLSKSIYLLGGFPPNWRYQHNTMHHGYTNIDGQDEDIDTPGFLRFSPNKPLWKIHKYQYLYTWFFYALMTIAWMTTKDFKQLLRYKKTNVPLSSKNKYNFFLIDLIFTKMLYYSIFLAIPIILIPVPWYWTVLFFLVMHFVTGFILSAIFQTAHVMPDSAFPIPDDNGNIDNSWAVHQLMTTSDYSPKSKMFSWLIGGLNYQIEHHLFANISHVHYRNISKLVKEIALKYNLPYHVQPSFLAALRNHSRMLKLLGR